MFSDLRCAECGSPLDQRININEESEYSCSDSSCSMFEVLMEVKPKTNKLVNKKEIEPEQIVKALIRGLGFLTGQLKKVLKGERVD